MFAYWPRLILMKRLSGVILASLRRCFVVMLAPGVGGSVAREFTQGNPRKSR